MTLRDLPRVVRFGDDEVYAAFCWYCGSDVYTEWLELPSCETLRAESYPAARAVCLGPVCGDAHEFGPRPLSLNRQEAWRAREPERLAARLDELRREAATAAGVSE